MNSADQNQKSNKTMPQPTAVSRATSLDAVTAGASSGRRSLADQVDDALAGGATCLQIREKDLDPEDFLAEAEIFKQKCRASNVPLIVNDSVEIALKCRADGIHVGQSDMEAGDVRTAVGEDMIIGVSAQTVQQALAAQAAGADYLGVGAVFPTSTKLDAVEVSREMLLAICSAVDIPVVAIGGITRDNLPELAGTGVAGVALVSAIFAADDIARECRNLLRLSEEMIEA